MPIACPVRCPLHVLYLPFAMPFACPLPAFCDAPRMPFTCPLRCPSHALFLPFAMPFACPLPALCDAPRMPFTCPLRCPSHALYLPFAMPFACPLPALCDALPMPFTCPLQCPSRALYLPFAMPSPCPLPALCNGLCVPLLWQLLMPMSWGEGCNISNCSGCMSVPHQVFLFSIHQHWRWNGWLCLHDPRTQLLNHALLHKICRRPEVTALLLCCSYPMGRMNHRMQRAWEAIAGGEQGSWSRAGPASLIAAERQKREEQELRRQCKHSLHNSRERRHIGSKSHDSPPPWDRMSPCPAQPQSKEVRKDDVCMAAHLAAP
eukprot:1158956-Pelagomonas_calceolata.AAC.7